MLKHLFAGGFLAGYRTYILGGLIALQALVDWAIGDMSFAQLIEQAPQIFAGLGFMTVRAGIANTLADLVREISNGQVAARNPKPPASTTLKSSAIGGLAVMLLAFALTGCASTPIETARERLYAAEVSYAAVVDTATAAIEAGQLELADAEDVQLGLKLVRMALDSAHESITAGDDMGAGYALADAAIYLEEVAAYLETRSDEEARSDE